MTRQGETAAPGFSPVERARRLLCNEIWNIGVIDQPVEDIARRGIVVAPRWLAPPPPGTMLADPSYRANADGSITLYAEQLDYRGRGVGEIWSAELLAGADLTAAKFKPLMAPHYHMSYPFPIDDGTRTRLLTAESWHAGAVLLWEDLGGAVRQVGTIMTGLAVIDPTLLWEKDRWWLFCTRRDKGPDGALFLFYASELTGPWTEHPCNPVQRGAGHSRPAGPLFRMGDTLVRPAQDCSSTYGGAVVLNAITRLDIDSYEESFLRRLGPVPGMYPSGLHTLSPAGERTLVDGKRWASHPMILPGKVMRRATRLRGEG